MTPQHEPETLPAGAQADVVARLAARETRLAESLARHERLRVDENVVDPTETEDRKDLAHRFEDGVTADAQIARDRAELAQTRTALARAREGLFGTCADCGEPIEPARLGAIVAATRCVKCQAAAERT